jgi:ribosome-associated translation inhibitor RaiA
MNMSIHTREAIEPPVRAYIEYRMFSAIGHLGHTWEHLDVHLDSTDAGARRGCTLALDLKAGGQVRARATAGHLYAAVDRSARRLVRRVERRLTAGKPATGKERRP